MQAPNTMQSSQNMRNNFSTRPALPAPPRLYNFGTTTPTLPGRFVNSEDEIAPGEVEMDNSIFYFPTRDLSHIFIRQWNRNGELERLTYVLEQPTTQAPLPPPPPPPMAQQQEPSQNESSMLAEALANLNQGLAQTFGQVGQALQGMQASIDAMSKQIASMTEGAVG